MNDFYCEWCECVTKKFNYISSQQSRSGKNKVSRPKWLLPGLSFLRFVATSTHLQLLDDDDFQKLIREVHKALDALCGNARSQQNSPTTKVRSSSTSSSHLGKPRSQHRRVGSGGRFADLVPTVTLSPSMRIENEIKELENRLAQKSRDRKTIGRIPPDPKDNTSGPSADPLTSLRSRNIAFPWRRGTRIGQGGAGVAFRAINCANGSIVCMKEILLSSIASRSLPSTYPEKLRRIAAEIDMIMKIEHPNIVRYFGIERYKRTIYICMEYCLSTVNEFLNDIRTFERRSHSKRKKSIMWSDSSDQDESLNNGQRFTSSLDVNEHVRVFVKQLLHALMALHEQNIVHCDVKGDNIFIANENGRYIVKLGDFNLSHRLELESPSSDGMNFRSTQKGTLYFKPPELEYVCKSDIWALGCTIIEMLTGKLPWTNVQRPPGDAAIYIQNQLLAKKGPPIPDGLPEEAREFIELCLKPNHEERKSARELSNEAYPRVRIGDT